METVYQYFENHNAHVILTVQTVTFVRMETVFLHVEIKIVELMLNAWVKTIKQFVAVHQNTKEILMSNVHTVS